MLVAGTLAMACRAVVVNTFDLFSFFPSQGLRCFVVSVANPFEPRGGTILRLV